jgi:mannose-6-phosphate isomerase-like protein (cupin superfamily)
MSVKIYALDRPLIEDLSHSPQPVLISAWQDNTLNLPKTGTHIGFVYRGCPHLERNEGQQSFGLYPGMYFCMPHQGCIGGQNSAGIVITCLNVQGMFTLGGPIEPKGRFTYINGGISSLLIPPINLGDPCLNALYFPPHRDQTLHTHVSDRIGIVVNGNGECDTPEGIISLKPGAAFWIPPDFPHKFRTAVDPLTLVVFHPDSDVGFTHQNNPMLNRTLVEGVSASQLPQIQTQLG